MCRYLMRFYNCICILFVVSLCTDIQGQINANINQYKELDGVSVSDILADKNGLIWIATYNNGLMRYNGYEFKKFLYDPKDSTTIKSNSILRLHEDPWGKIWISTNDGDLIRYDPILKKFKKYTYQYLTDKKYLEHRIIITDFCTLGGKLLFSADMDAPLEKSILMYDEKIDQVKIFAPGSIHPDYAYLFIPDHSGHAMIIGQDAQLYDMNISGTVNKLDPHAEIQIMANQEQFADARYDNQNKLWMFNKNAELNLFEDIHKSHTKSFSFQQLLSQGIKGFIPTTLEIDQDQNIWMGAYQGLFLFQKNKEKFQKIDLPLDANGTPFKISTLYFDSFNNLWIGTQTGLLKYESKPEFISYSNKGIDTSQKIKGFSADISQSNAGDVTVASYEFTGAEVKIMVHSLNLQTNSFHQFTLNDILPKGTNVTGVSNTGNDTLMIGSDRGAFQITGKGTKVTKITLPGVPATHPGIRQFYKDKYGNEWLGSSNYLYKKLKGKESFVPIDLSKLPGGSELSNNVMVQDGKKYGLWILSENGLFLYDYSKDAITRHGYDTKGGNAFIAQSTITTFTQDSIGIVWVGIKDGGLNKYEISSGKNKIYTIKEGLPDMTVSSILYDDKNDALWLGTGNGLSRFDIKTERFTNYSSADGISGKSFFSGLKTRDGQFFIGGDELIRFKPEEIKSGSHPPIISIDDIKVSNRSILSDLDSLNNFTTITLKHNQNNISIDYQGAHYTDSKSNRFAYRLENFDQEWNEVGSQRIAYYTNLPSGSYTFKVKAANSNGTWTETPSTIHITILPPWWKTPWAYGIYLITLIGIGSLMNRYFKQRIIKQERERSQLKELEQAKEIEKAYKELEKSHDTLKTTQSQLVQAEKMASLGELTAGIAHEIQNPLNFVNNFSDINIELISEMKDELSADHKQEAIDLADTIQSNLEKITTHGRRADSIVKNMLQHSRKSNGVKEPTDINALADEYVRLAYHGLRAKDKSFNAMFKTDLDPAIGEVDVVPQDIGRVLLNLITNAFHAVTEENKTRKELDPDSKYAPLVSVITKNISDKANNTWIEIRIIDNGPGIPQAIKDKIFQPFFTTKPTGQGTGLGLSLAYDIVKVHGGNLIVNSEEIIGSEFVITIPIT